MAMVQLAGTLVLRRSDSERWTVAYVTAQLFILIYLQRIELGPFLGNSASFSAPLVALIAGSMLGIGLGWFTFSDKVRFAAYLFFVATSLISEAFMAGRLSSLMQVLMIYACWTLTSVVSDAAYRRILNAFNMMMIPPAAIMIIQFSYQKLTGQPDFLTMTGWVPDSFVVQGYSYDLHFPWNSNFTRPCGIVFLEASFSSMFAASATIIEIMYFRRWYLILLMVVATCLSMGATGLTMLMIAAPFLLMREKVEIIVPVIFAGLAALMLAVTLDASLPLVSRVDELDARDSSGGERIMLPLERLSELMIDPSYFLVGDGAGSTLRGALFEKKADPGKSKTAVISPWPMVKVLNEYGLLSMVAYLIFFGLCMRGKFNVPLKIALFVEFMFTGGYLVNPAFLALLYLMFMSATPEGDAEIG